MDPIEQCPIHRYDSGRIAAEFDSVIAEARVELQVNDEPRRIAMLCLPRNLDALAVGFLRGEGICRSREDISDVVVDDDARRVVVTGDFDADALEAVYERWTWGSGCGGGGTSRDVDAPRYRRVGEGVPIAPEKLIELAGAFQKQQELWTRTGGVHACALAGADGIVLAAEDVGRHNAFDKVIGRALLDGVALDDKLALTTGRLSAEIVSKAVACGLPMLASRSAVTALAVALAKRFALTLVGFLRGRRMNVYTHPQRIAAGGNPEETS